MKTLIICSKGKQYSKYGSVIAIKAEASDISAGVAEVFIIGAKRGARNAMAPWQLVY